MAQKTIKSEMTLHSERLGSEKQIQAVLIDWGMGDSAIQRILAEHRARQGAARQRAFGEAKPTVGKRINHAPVNSCSPSR